MAVKEVSDGLKSVFWSAFRTLTNLRVSKLFCSYQKTNFRFRRDLNKCLKKVYLETFCGCLENELLIGNPANKHF